MAAMKKYVIEQPYYRPGVGYFAPGSVVEVPADEKPAKGWKPFVEPPPASEDSKVDADKKPAKGADEKPAKGKRPSDGDPF